MRPRGGSAAFFLALIAGCGGNEFAERESGAGGGGKSGTDVSASAGGGSSSSSSGSGVGGADGCDNPDRVCLTDPGGGWEGPAAVYVGTAPPASCPAPWKNMRAAGVGMLQGGIACGQCACGAPSGVGCAPPAVELYSDTTCTNLQATITAGPCMSMNYLSAKAQPPKISGSCTPSGDMTTLEPPAWSEQALFCSASFDGEVCGNGGVCVPKPMDPFGPTLCVFKDGDHDCPSGFANKNVAYAGIADTRACSACSCGPPAASCGGKASIAHTPDCSSLGTSLSTGACTTLRDGAIYGMEYIPGAVFTGPCAPGGGEPQGELAPDKPITVCCAAQ